MVRTCLLLALAALAGCGRPAADCGELAITGAWVRAAPPGADVTAGYFVAENRGAAPVLLTGASGPDFSRVEMHRSRQVDGRMVMTPVNALEIASGAREAFEPGGLHLMLFSPGELASGDPVRLNLVCGENGRGELNVTAEVRAAARGAGHGGHGA